MWSGAGFWVILDRESFFAFDANAFDSLVIQVYVGHFDMFAFLDVTAAHLKAVVLRSDLGPASDEVFDRMIEAAVTVVHLVGLDTRCQCQ